MIQGRQLLAEPSHGAAEIMEIELLDVVDAVIVAPIFAAVVGARLDHSEEYNRVERRSTLLISPPLHPDRYLL
jgi:hypothetical protein